MGKKRKSGGKTVPAHRSKRGSCLTCEKPHTVDEHRFHGEQSFKRTHKKHR